jgi:enamine deaminase RidA (YjgF/YER057c/UK114 family)
MSEERREGGFKAVTLDDALIRDYLIKILGEGEEFAQEFYQELVEKSELFKHTLAKDRLPSLKEEELGAVFERIFAARRKKDRIIEETGMDKLKKAISDLLYGDEKGGFFKKKAPERTWEEKVDEFAKQIRGVDRKSARDIAAELLHFTFPDKYILWTSWIWDPESETGAIVFLKEEPPTGGRGRRMYGETYEQFKQVYEQIAEKLQEFGIKVKGYLFVDIFLAMIYATYVDYMTLSTMHSAKGFFPPAGVMAKRLLGVNAPVEFT